MNTIGWEFILGGGVVCAALLSTARHPALRPWFQAAGGATAVMAGVAVWVWLAVADLSVADDGVAREAAGEQAVAATNIPLPTDEGAFFIPESSVIIPPGRPQWVESVSVERGNTRWIAVTSGPYARRTDCVAALDKQIAVTVNDFIREHLGSSLAPKLFNYSETDLRNRLVHDTYEETIQVSVGPMIQLHAKIDFPDSFVREVEERWRQLRSASRLGQVGLVFAAVLALLGTVAGFFRIDNATRGYYTGRLQFFAAGAILALVAVGIFMARLIPWI